MSTVLLLVIAALFVGTGLLTMSTGNSSRNYTRQAGTGLLLVGIGFALWVPGWWLLTVLGIVSAASGGWTLFKVYRNKSRGQITA
jgi:hypothetical protein